MNYQQKFQQVNKKRKQYILSRKSQSSTLQLNMKQINITFKIYQYLNYLLNLNSNKFYNYNINFIQILQTFKEPTKSTQIIMGFKMHQKRFNLYNLIALFLMITVVNCQSSGTIFGIGIGTFIIILAIIFSIVWCLVCRSSSRPQLYSIFGIIIPILLIIIFVFMPKQINRPVSSTTTDSNFIPHVVFLVIAILAFLIGGAFLLLDYAFTYKKAKNIARSAFKVKDQQHQHLNTLNTLKTHSNQERPLLNERRQGSIQGQSQHSQLH